MEMGPSPALTGPEPECRIATTVEEKAALITEIAFPTVMESGEMAAHSTAVGHWHLQIRRNTVWKALFTQAPQKAPGADRISFKALRMLWDWNADRLVALARQCARLEVHLQAWKTIRGMMLKKSDKMNYSLIKI